MRKSIFNYPVTRPFPYPWLPWAAFFGGICATVILTIFNLAANGYELYNVYVPDPNKTVSLNERAWFEKPPWSWTNKISSSCQAYLITRGTQIYTNNHLLEYKIGYMWTMDGNQSTPVYSVSYHNDNLHDCTIDFLSLTNSNDTDSSLYISPTCMIYDGSIPIYIELEAESQDYEPVRSAQGISTLNRPSASSNRLGRSIVNWYGGNVYLAGVNVSGYWDGQWQHLSSRIGSVFWTDYDDQNEIDPKEIDLKEVIFTASSMVEWLSTFGEDMITEKLATNSGNISQVGIKFSILADGLAKAYYSLTLTDLGQSSELNIFDSPRRTLDFMNRSLQYVSDPDEQRDGLPWNEILSNKKFLENPSSDIPPSDVTSFYQWANLSQPKVNPTTFDAQYLCQVPKLKTTGSLFVSVVVADFVFLQIIWTIFTWITAYFLESRHPDAQYCVGCTKAVALGQLDLENGPDAGSRPKQKSKQSCNTSSHNVANPEGAQTWSDSISDDLTVRNDAFRSTEAPLVWSDTVSTRSDTASLRSAPSVRRRQDGTSYSLLPSP